MLALERSRGATSRVVLLLAATAVAAMMSVASLHNVLGSIEDWTMDKRFATRGAHTPKDVAIVSIDDKTMSDLGLQWPFPRRYHASVIRQVADDRARAIAVDVQFTEATDPADDSALIAAVGEADANAGARHRRGCVVLGTSEVDREGHTAVFGGDDIVRRVGARVGFIGLRPDSGGVLRRVPWGSSEAPLDGERMIPLESLSLVAAEIATGRPIARSQVGSSTTMAYVGPPGTVSTYSYADVLHNRVPASALKGKVVVIGATAPSLGDMHLTPYGAGKPMSGPEIQANAIVTAMHGFPLGRSRTRDVPLIVLFAFLVPVASLFFRWRWCLLLAAVAAVLYLVAAQRSFDHGVLVVVTWPLLAFVLGTLVAAFLRPSRPVRAAYS